MLVQTKLHAPVARERVARPQLLRSLTTPPYPRLALLRPPAGAGKTTLLFQWTNAAEEERPFAWVALKTEAGVPADRSRARTVGAVRA